MHLVYIYKWHYKFKHSNKLNKLIIWSIGLQKNNTTDDISY